jgi:hypothetical protein
MQRPLRGPSAFPGGIASAHDRQHDGVALRNGSATGIAGDHEAERVQGEAIGSVSCTRSARSQPKRRRVRPRSPCRSSSAGWPTGCGGAPGSSSCR